MIPTFNEICTNCGGYPDQAILQIFGDNCFRVAEGKDTHGEFCIGDFAFPVDGYSCIGLTVDVSGGDVVIFDDKLDLLTTSPPSTLLQSGKAYARGAMIRITYPLKDNHGEDLVYSSKTVLLSLYDSTTFTESIFPINDLFTIFSNAKSNKVSDLINKIKITNLNTDYKVRVSALVVLGIAE